VQAAARLLAEGGREAVSTRAVAAAAGVQAPTIYRHDYVKVNVGVEIRCPVGERTASDEPDNPAIILEARDGALQ
jgi:hypothetical protein